MNRFLISFCLTFFFCLIIVDVSAQIKEPAYSFSIEPTLGNRFIIYKNKVNQVYKDSIKKADHGRTAIGATFTFSFKTQRKQRIYTGLQFHNFGFTRKKENIKFLDTIHPDIGIMNDLSQTGGAYVDFNYRYMYLSIPLMFSYRINKISNENTRIHWMIGGSASVLVKHDIKAVFHGFSTRGGVKTHYIKNSEGQAERINVNFHTGIRIENLVYGKSTFVFIQPELLIPTLVANGAKERHRLWALGLQVGLIYQPDKDKD